MINDSHIGMLVSREGSPDDDIMGLLLRIDPDRQMARLVEIRDISLNDRFEEVLANNGEAGPPGNPQLIKITSRNYIREEDACWNCLPPEQQLKRVFFMKHLRVLATPRTVYTIGSSNGLFSLSWRNI